MSLNDIKRKRLAEQKKVADAKKKSKKKRKKKLVTDPSSGSQKYVQVDEDEDDPIEEAKFIKICVASIKSPKAKADPEPERPKSDKQRVKDSQETVKEYSHALEKLRESVEERCAENIDPRTIRFGGAHVNRSSVDVSQIRFNPYR